MEIVRSLLLERLGVLPNQTNPEDREEDVEEADIFESRLYQIADAAKIVAWLYLVFEIISIGLKIPDTIASFQQMAGSIGGLNTLYISAAVFSYLSQLTFLGFYFLILQAVSEIIYLFLDIKALLESRVNDDSSN